MAEAARSPGSGRVFLRPFSLDDAPDVFRYAGDPEVSRYLDWKPHASIAESKGFIRACLARQPRKPIAFAVEDLAGRTVIGSVDIRVIDPLRRFGEIGYSLARPYWGRGYNLDAVRLLLDYGFADLRLLRIQATCDVDNRRSFRTMEKVGMVRENVLVRARRRKGIWVDCYLYGIVWREWARLCALAPPADVAIGARLRRGRRAR